MPKTIVISDETVNRYGFRTLTAGIRTSNFLLNPVMLYMHTRGNVIGHWTNLRTEGSQLLADPVFDMDDPFAAIIANKVAKGIIRSASPGFVPLKFSDSQPLAGQTKATVVESELLEISIVDIPANANAVTCAVYGTEGNIIELAASNSNEVIPLLKTKEMTKLPLFIALFAQADINLQAAGTEDEVLKSVETLVQNNVEMGKKLERLTAEVETMQKKRVTDMVDSAIKQKRISLAQRELYIKLGTANPDETEQIINALPVPQSLKAAIDAGAGTTDKTKDWTFADWQKKDSAGLTKMKSENPEMYKLLFKNEFGTEPKIN